MRTGIRAAVLVGFVALAGSLGVAHADPPPGFSLDPVELERRMDACMAYAVPEQELLMGWVDLRTGAQRNWRCSSLRHMMLGADDRDDGDVHDPYVNVPDFMRCVDTVVTGGFPRPGDPGKTKLIKQYNGTTSTAIVVVNDVSGDIVTIYTTGLKNDWTGCANAL